MKNPLNKRILREMKTDRGKYMVILIFMVITIGLVSGDLVAADSMITAYRESFEKYNVENGHFRLKKEASDQLAARFEKENITVYKDYYTERTYEGADGNEKKLRIYKNRQDVNRACLMEGTFPEKEDEIAIDRMYADNNDLKPGDPLMIDDKSFTITGLVALSDYSAMFESNSDMMFDSINFSVAVVSDSCFESLGQNRIHYNYAWTYNAGNPADDTQEKEWADDLSDSIVRDILDEEGGSTLALSLGIVSMGNEIEEFLPRYANNAITFTGDDMGSDRNAMIAFLYILIAVMAFIFGVTISHTITKEAAVIGTLRASGYTKAELFRQYIAMPVLVTLAGAVIGNILGYSIFKDFIATLYYGSYSLTTYVTLWNSEAFIMTTVIPVLLMLLITSITLIQRLRLSPLTFIRRDFSRKQSRKAARLPKVSFFNRFRLRIILQNKSGYITLFFGILIATALLLFGLMFEPLLDDVASMAINSMPAKYQYMLKEETETENTAAEKFAVTTMDTYANGYDKEGAAVYGIFENSRYIKEKLPKKGVLISSGMAEKYLVGAGDTILLKEQFENRLLEFKVEGIFDSPTTITVYMSHDYYCEVFDQDDDYYSGYFSDEKLTDINENKIYSCITDKDMTKLADQMTVSAGGMFTIFKVFAIGLFILVVYLLTKIILEKNSNSISMVKILGYEDSEIGRLYLVATSWVVVISVLISFVLVTTALKEVFVVFMKSYSGWIPFQMSLSTYGQAFLLTIVSYLVVALMQMRKIKKVPMDEALKNVE